MTRGVIHSGTINATRRDDTENKRGLIKITIIITVATARPNRNIGNRSSGVVLKWVAMEMRDLCVLCAAGLGLGGEGWGVDVCLYKLIVTC